MSGSSELSESSNGSTILYRRLENHLKCLIQEDSYEVNSY
jgi:hypothetical protein